MTFARWIAHFNEEIKVTARLEEWENRLKFDYDIYDSHGRKLTTGSTTQVAIDMKKNEMLFVSPKVLFEKLGLPVPV